MEWVRFLTLGCWFSPHPRRRCSSFDHASLCAPRRYLPGDILGREWWSTFIIVSCEAHGPGPRYAGLASLISENSFKNSSIGMSLEALRPGHWNKRHPVTTDIDAVDGEVLRLFLRDEESISSSPAIDRCHTGLLTCQSSTEKETVAKEIARSQSPVLLKILLDSRKEWHAMHTKPKKAVEVSGWVGQAFVVPSRQFGPVIQSQRPVTVQ